MTPSWTQVLSIQLQVLLKYSTTKIFHNSDIHFERIKNIDGDEQGSELQIQDNPCFECTLWSYNQDKTHQNVANIVVTEQWGTI